MANWERFHAKKTCCMSGSQGTEQKDAEAETVSSRKWYKSSCQESKVISSQQNAAPTDISKWPRVRAIRTVFHFRLLYCNTYAKACAVKFR